MIIPESRLSIQLFHNIIAGSLALSIVSERATNAKSRQNKVDMAQMTCCHRQGSCPSCDLPRPNRRRGAPSATPGIHRPLCQAKPFRGLRFVSSAHLGMNRILGFSPPVNGSRPHGAIRCADFFCGIGGFHEAARNLGLEIVFACDIDEQARHAYSTNYGL